MSIPRFALLYDYRCPFARIMHEHVALAIEAGLELEVTYEPFTLSQGHVGPGLPAVWDDPAQRSTLLALEVSVAVRDHDPRAFGDLHRSLFRARHIDGIALSSRDQLIPLLHAADVDADKVFAIVDEGAPRSIIAERWHHYHDDLDVFGVPTFIVDDADATFVRLMTEPDDRDPDASRATVERVVDLVLHHGEINELKHTKLSR